jgi:hypothetical protein
MHSINLINPSRTSEDIVGSRGSTPAPSPMLSPPVYDDCLLDDCLVIFMERHVFLNMRKILLILLWPYVDPIKTSRFSIKTSRF